MKKFVSLIAAAAAMSALGTASAVSGSNAEPETFGQDCVASGIVEPGEDGSLGGVIDGFIGPNAPGDGTPAQGDGTSDNPGSTPFDFVITGCFLP